VGQDAHVKNFLNISYVIIAETVNRLSVVSSYITLSLYTEIKVESETFHLEYAKNNNL